MQLNFIASDTPDQCRDYEQPPHFLFSQEKTHQEIFALYTTEHKHH